MVSNTARRFDLETTTDEKKSKDCESFKGTPELVEARHEREKESERVTDDTM